MQSSTLALLQGDDEGEESVDAIAKELEKSDSADAKRSPKGAKGSPKKGKKPAMEGEKSKEEWVDLIFGANGEKVTNTNVYSILTLLRVYSLNFFSTPRDIPQHHLKNLLTSKRGCSVLET